MSDESKASAIGLSTEAEITLGLLNAVHENSAITQRSVSRDLGIALGLANAYLKRAAKKGLIKISQIPPNRYAYYLTPQGFAEKSRLTAQYLSTSFNLFRVARQQYGELFGRCAAQGWTRLALAGIGDVGEIATLSLGDHAVELVAFVDLRADGLTQYAELPVVDHPDRIDGLDALVLTDLRDPQGTFDTLTRAFPPDRVLAPPFLKISRHAVLVEGDGP
ncbi:MAG: winged helix-turn-helix transcriptional regulator [Rhodospirillales bacterium]|nr:winged helix-turn-helix transcriptional regulator [Rhodospirillales bacterium]